MFFRNAAKGCERTATSVREDHVEPTLLFTNDLEGRIETGWVRCVSLDCSDSRADAVRRCFQLLLTTAIIALMEQEIVRKLRAMSPDDFLAGVGLSQFLGAFPVNTAAFVGYRLFGVTGALLSVGVFLLPSVVLVMLLSSVYFHLHAIPALGGVLAGLTPVVIALILTAAWSLGRKVVQRWFGILTAAGALIAGLMQVQTAWVLLLAGALGLLAGGNSAAERKAVSAQGVGTNRTYTMQALLPFVGKISTLSWTFLKIGLLFFGGGFVLVPLLRSEIVTQLGWLTQKEFLDGLAISSLTPGPIAVVATFVGYKQGGIGGAIASTAALLLPGTLLMIWIGRGYTHFGGNKFLHRILAGINPGTVGLIVSAAVLLGKHSLVSLPAFVSTAVSLFLLARLHWHPALVLGLGALLGFFKVY